MNTHQMKLAPEPFKAIKSGRKTIESRLCDEKRRAIQPGDTIIFTNREEAGDRVTVKVVGLLRYGSFADLFSRNEPSRFGGPSTRWLLGRIRTFYSIEEEERYGVVGIEFSSTEPHGGRASAGASGGG